LIGRVQQASPGCVIVQDRTSLTDRREASP
jgi:hypothetical protein